MIVFLFGVSNVGKTTIGKIIADKLRIAFYDVDEEIKRYYHITLEEFVHTGTIRERDAKRGKLIGRIVNSDSNCVIAVTPMTNVEYFSDFIAMKNVIAIELIDSAEHIFERLVFSDEDDNIYEDIEYKNLHRDYYMADIKEDLRWYGKVYHIVKNKFNIDNLLPEQAAQRIIELYDLEKLSGSGGKC